VANKPKVLSNSQQDSRQLADLQLQTIIEMSVEEVHEEEVE